MLSACWAKAEEGVLPTARLLLLRPTHLHPCPQASPGGLPNEIPDTVQLLMDESVCQLPVEAVDLRAGNTYCKGPNNRGKHHHGRPTPTARVLLAHTSAMSS